MRNYLILMLLYVVHLPGLCSPKQPPRDIRIFAANAEACGHLGGEYDGELAAGQKRDMERNIRKYCSAASRQLPILRKKYRHDDAMLETIEHHVNEAVTDYR